MRGKEFQQIRESMKMGRREFGRAVGYTGSDRTIWKAIRDYEAEAKDIPPVLARLVFLLSRVKMGDSIPADDGGNVLWPSWIETERMTS